MCIYIYVPTHRFRTRRQCNRRCTTYGVHRDRTFREHVAITFLRHTCMPWYKDASLKSAALKCCDTPNQPLLPIPAETCQSFSPSRLGISHPDVSPCETRRVGDTLIPERRCPPSCSALRDEDACVTWLKRISRSAADERWISVRKNSPRLREAP